MTAPLTLAQALQKEIGTLQDLAVAINDDGIRDLGAVCESIDDVICGLQALALPSAPQEPDAAGLLHNRLGPASGKLLDSKPVQHSVPQEPPQDYRPDELCAKCGVVRPCFAHDGQTNVAPIPDDTVRFVGGSSSPKAGGTASVASAPQTVSTEALALLKKLADEQWKLGRQYANDFGKGLAQGAENLQVVLRSITASAPPQGWQPIATAPKDGTPIIIHTEGGLIGEARWQGEGSDEGWWWAGTDPGDYHSSRIEEYEVAHWMPLPGPPSAPTAQEKP